MSLSMTFVKVYLLLIKIKLLLSWSSVNRWLDYLFNIWPFTTMEIGPIGSKMILPTTRKTFKKLFRLLNLAKPGHTGDEESNRVKAEINHLGTFILYRTLYLDMTVNNLSIWEMDHPGPIFHLFSVFSNNSTF